MQTLLVTVRGPRRSVDMELPGDIPISDLLPLLLEICGPPGLAAAITGHINRTPWCLKAVNASEPLKTSQTLIDAQVLDGAVLVLQERMAVSTQATQVPQQQNREFRPRTILPSQSTGGVGVVWEREELSS
ncbi:MAG TPA: EsaB/YukD family protein [Ktedonobacteraceae bacterium]|nr:EsaB/YukD family protein [Ktedonobacteraceae bacterium]